MGTGTAESGLLTVSVSPVPHSSSLHWSLPGVARVLAEAKCRGSYLPRGSTSILGASWLWSDVYVNIPCRWVDSPFRFEVDALYVLENFSTLIDDFYVAIRELRVVSSGGLVLWSVCCSKEIVDPWMVVVYDDHVCFGGVYSKFLFKLPAALGSEVS